MFAVPGWSVSADALKPQVETDTPKHGSNPGSLPPNGISNKSRKRKRGPGSNKNVEITDENLADFWRKVIEQKDPITKTGINHNVREKRSKERKTERDEVGEEAQDLDEEAFEGFQDDVGDLKVSEQEASIRNGKRKKKRKKEKEDIDEGNIQPQPAQDSSGLVETKASIEDGKSKYEERKAKAAAKHEQRALLQANGTLPPTRPKPNSISTVESLSPKPPKPLKASKLRGNSESPEATLAGRASDTRDSTKEQPSPTAPGPPPTSAKLTPLQQRMAAKLTSARFRHLNQTLYTTPSDQAMRLFSESPQAYNSYHAGFRAQVAVWPQNPVEGFIEDINSRGGVSIPSQKRLWKNQKKEKKQINAANNDASTNGVTSRNIEPLPRNRYGLCTIADLGCGDATLASSLQPSKKALNLHLISFDLAKGDTPNANLITVADISNLSAVGIKDGSVDIAICCLSLMGTNWVDVVDECARIVRTGGEMWVAEIKSRFTRPNQVVKKKKGDGIGKNKNRKKAASNDDDGENEEPADLSELEDMGGRSRKDETDVSAFVEVFRKRGFNLKGEPDMSNKMFARMRFLKALTRTEKEVENKKGGRASFGDGFKGKQQRGKTKFLAEEEGNEADENTVLKPCVYKTR